MSLGLIGKKSGMSRVFQEDGDSIPVSIVSVLGNYVAGIKTKDADGYDAVLVSKHHNPNWNPSSINDIEQNHVNKLFEFNSKTLKL